MLRFWGILLCLGLLSLGCTRKDEASSESLPNGSFSLLLSPANLSIQAGQSAPLTVTSLRTGGHADNIALSLESSQAGLSGSGVIAGSASSGLLNLQVADSTPIGSFACTVVGQSGSLRRTASLVLTVAAPTQDFSLHLSSTSLSVTAGQTGSIQVTLSRKGGFTDPVRLELEGAPQGVEASESLTGNVGQLVILVPTSVTPGNYAISVKGSAGSLSHSVPLTLTVAPAPIQDFSLSLAPTSISVLSGQAAQVQVEIQRMGAFPGAVLLDLVQAPEGVSASDSVTGNSVLMALKVDAQTAPGSYDVAVRGSSGGLAHTAILRLTVLQGPIPDFSLKLSPSILSLQAGQSGVIQVEAQRSGGLNASIALTLEGAPQGVQGKDTLAGTSGSMAILVASTVPAGDYTFLVQGSVGVLTHCVPLTLKISSPPHPGFSLSLDPSQVELSQGQSSSLRVQLSRTGGFLDSVDLSLEGAPAGLTGTAILTGDSGILPLTAASTTLPGSYRLLVKGASGSLSSSALLDVLIRQATIPDFAFQIASSSLEIIQGSIGSLGIQVQRQGGFSEALTIDLLGAPEEITGTTTISGNSGDLLISVASSLPLGTYACLVRATGGGLIHTLPIKLSIVAPPDSRMKKASWESGPIENVLR